MGTCSRRHFLLQLLRVIVHSWNAWHPFLGMDPFHIKFVDLLGWRSSERELISLQWYFVPTLISILVCITLCPTLFSIFFATGTVLPMLEAVMSVVPAENLAVHFHDTYGQSLPNILVSLQVSYLLLEIRCTDCILTHTLRYLNLVLLYLTPSVSYVSPPSHFGTNVRPLWILIWEKWIFF